MLRILLRIIGGVALLVVAVVAGFALSLRAALPVTDIVEVQLDSTTPITDENSSILIFGATRNTGLEVAKLLVSRGDNVTAFVRPTSDRTELAKLGVDFVVGDAMQADTVVAAFEDRQYRAVVTTIGCLRCDLPPDFEGNRHIVDAARARGVGRLVLVTTIGAGDSEDAPPWLSRQLLAGTMPLKTQAEEYLKASGLDYTIVRPGGLRNHAPTGNGVLTADADSFGFIFRSDLARLLVACLDDPRTIGRTLTAVDARRRFAWSNE